MKEVWILQKCGLHAVIVQDFNPVSRQDSLLSLAD